MTASRTSNKQILDAISEQSQAISALVAAITQTQAPVTPVTTQNVAPAPVNDAPVVDGETSVQFPESYLSHMATKIQDTANDKGVRYIEYARRNLKGENKIAYCTADRWANLKDKGLIGPMAVFDPAS